VTTAAPKLRVLFACIGNSGRSIMAEAFAKHYGGANVLAASGGSKPLGHVLPTVVDAMREKGIDVSKEPSKGFDNAWITHNIDIVVTMGCGDDACPAFIGKKMSDWDLEDPKGKDIATVRSIRDDVERRVVALLAEHGITPRRRDSDAP
jgi:protein-tyrosine-phosphatase